jgi:hypothetical protein
MKIIVDADACPKKVLQICAETAREFAVPLHTVASFNHHIVSDHHTVVGNAPHETDLALINMTSPGDIVVTQDWGLAALALGKGASALSPGGRIFHPETIDFLLEEREIKARLRRGGGRTRGPRKRTAEDDRRFAAALRRLVSELASKHPG